MNETPLVSITVITYNSEKYILETLESLKQQTYKNVELVVSDDCSTDSTVKLCQKWVEENGDRFRRVIIVESGFNTGISANINRALQACEGEWIKSIAGDDLLLPDCVSNYMNYIRELPDICVFFSRLRPFSIVDGQKQFYRTVPAEEERDYINVFNGCSSHEQFRMLLKDGCFIQAPTCFCRNTFMKEHPYFERYRFEEDYPMWLNLTRQGYRLNIMFEETVLYRNGDSLSHRATDYYSRNYMSTRALFFWNECYDYYRAEDLPEAYNRYRKLLLKYELTEAFTQNHKTKINSVIVRFIHFVVNRFAKYTL